MSIRIHNTMTRTVQELHTEQEGKVQLYACGPTVYNYAHIGNMRYFAAVDLFVRYLQYKGLHVEHAMNITDVDDKTIKGSITQGIKLKEFTETYTEKFLEDLHTLQIKIPEHLPKATEHIEDMIELIQTLINKGHAYEKNGTVFYKISSFKNYGALARLDKTELKTNADGRLSDEYEKEDARDFALWKAHSTDDEENYWESPWGKGRPGWHIECSCMSKKLYGPTFDVHCGGVDLIFPHHTNEIAQSEGAHDKPYVKHWFHVEHLLVDSKKMSKSLGNYYTLRDILAKGYDGRTIRYHLLSTHYRQQLNFTLEGLEAAKNTLKRIDECVLKLKESTGVEEAGIEEKKLLEEFEKCMDEDLNISGALGALFDYIREVNKKKLSAPQAAQSLQTLYEIDNVLSLGLREVSRGELDEEIRALITKREEARAHKNWAEADRIRDILKEKGIQLDDTAQGVKYKKVN